MADNKFHTGRILQNMAKVRTELPPVMANHAQNYFANSWARGGWEGQRWTTPNRKIEGTKEYKYPFKGAERRHTRATMVQSGALRRSAGMSVRKASFERIELIVDLPYAQIHNEGGMMANGGMMPKRQYMGDSQYLRAQQTTKIRQYVDKIWQP